MEREKGRKDVSPFNNSRDVTMAADGLEEAVDDKTLFCTPAPIAASTVAANKESRRGQQLFADSKGSFLDDMSCLSLQSASGLDLTNQLKQLNFSGLDLPNHLKQLNFNASEDRTLQDRASAKADSAPDLIQFSGASAVDSDNQDENKSDSLTDVSSRSSMGLIPTDMLEDCELLASVSETDLSGSVLPLNTPRVIRAASKVTDKPEIDSSHSTVKEKTSDSTDWSDNSKQDSKQDSKDMPWGRSHLDTVKKRPQEADRSGGRQGSVARGAVSLFAGHLLDNVEEGEELDQSVHQVELGDEDLRQLDADVDFSDLEEDILSAGGRGESGDEDFDFDEPMLALPSRDQVERVANRVNGELQDRYQTLQAELAEAESRLAEGQESEEEGAAPSRNTVTTNSDTVADFGLDSCYFRQTQLPFAGDGEEAEVGTNRSSMARSQQRGAAEGEHSLTKLRRQFMSGDGSEKEIDSDQEKEEAKKSASLMARERGQGADEEDSDRSNLPLPVGLEDKRPLDKVKVAGARSADWQQQFSFTTRQSAEGGTVHSPVPWGGTGDGSSGNDSDGNAGRTQITRPSVRFVSGAAENQNPLHSSSQSAVASLSTKLIVKDQYQLQPEFLLPTSQSSALHDSIVSSQGLEGSTFNVEDILQSRTEFPTSALQHEQIDEPRVEASGFNAADAVENPFEGPLVDGSISLGLSLEADEEGTSKFDRSVEVNSSKEGKRGDISSKAEFPPPSSGFGLPSKGSGSFDGPFRKPRLPAPSKKTMDSKPVTSTSKSSESWKTAAFSAVDDEVDRSLEKQLKEFGIDIGDDEFKTADEAKAMLDADEKEFEEENRFAQHHQLSLAAEGLAWEGDDSHFSGYLGGEENPEHLETSIGAYMATRTETLGTLGGDPCIPRPEFGAPVESPPHRRFPVKLMSPPSTASSFLSTQSRTECEGNENGDNTLLALDSTLQAESESPVKRIGQTGSSARQAATLANGDGVANTTGAGPTFDASDLGEISALLDLTKSADLSDQVLSMSAVFDFVKNNSYIKSGDFASAMLQHTKSRKQQVGRGDLTRGGAGSGRGELTQAKAQPPQQNTTKGFTKDSNRNFTKESNRDYYEDFTKDSYQETSKDLNKDSPTSHSAKSASSPNSSPSSLASPKQRASRLPVRVGANTSPREGQGRQASLSRQPERGVTAAGGLSRHKSQSTSRILSHPDLQDGDLVRRSYDDSVIKEQQNFQSSDKPKTSSSKTIFARQGDGQGEDSSAVPLSVSKSRNQTAGGDRLSKNELAMKRGSDLPRVRPASSLNRQGVLLNIPTSAQKGKVVGVEGMENGELYSHHHENNNCNNNTEHNLCGKMPSQNFMQTPPQRLNAGGSQSGDTAACRVQEEGVTTSSFSQAPQKQATRTRPKQDQVGNCTSQRKGVSISMEKERWKESRPLTNAASADVLPVRQEMSKVSVPELREDRLVCGKQALSLAPEAQRQQASKPTLLTGTSLMSTEFAQRYLISDQTPQQPQHLSSDCGAPAVVRIPPDHLSPMKSTQPPALSNASSARSFAQQNQMVSASSDTTGSSAQQNQIVSAHKYGNCEGKLQQNQTLPTQQRHEHFDETSRVPAMDETGLSVYYELREDLHQTTLVGGEASAMGSFWGKSPLYQSTPALEQGKVAALSMVAASRLEEKELTTPSQNLVTPRVQRQLIDVQRCVDFPEFCCLGVSEKAGVPITNRTAYGVICRFQLLKLIHNDKAVKLDSHSPFEWKPKMSISPGASETLPVLFVPKRPGKHVCQVEVLTQSLNPALEPTSSIVHLRAVAEVPSIQISPSVEVLSLGEVMWGACVSKTIKLRNVKKASLPVRLSIWASSSVWHCFTFDSTDSTNDVSLISMSSRPESLGRNVVTVILPGCDAPDLAKTVEVKVFCRPPTKELNRALAQRPADDIEGKVEIEVDTPVQYLPPLASLTLRATVGMPRLLIPPSNMSLTFKSRADQNIQESVLLTNSGNIAMEIALSVTTFPECFVVAPSRLTIKPGGRAEVDVTFSPLESDVYRYQSLLLLDIEPEGPSYEIPMEATVTRPALQCPLPFSILTSNSFLAFSGVALNQTKSLTLRLFNKDSSQAEFARVEIRQSSDCFKLVSSSGEWQQRCEVVIGAREKVPLTVIFCPAAVQGYAAKLVIRKQGTQSSKFSIPLTGYGGRSSLSLSGACQTSSGQRWLELGPLTAGHNMMQELVLTNTGVRAAFVRAAAFCDMRCEDPVEPGRVAVEPNNFVLAPGCSTKVVVAMSVARREVELVRERKEVVAVVRFHHGDEVMRQKYLRVSNKEGSRNQESWQAAFRQPFANDAQDSVILEGRSISDSPDDSSAFFHHLSSERIALLGSPQVRRDSASSMSVSAILRPDAQTDHAIKASKDRPVAQNRDGREDGQRFDSTGQFLIPCRPESDDGDWTIKPDFITLTVGENVQKMLQLINFSRQPLSFELTWPPSTVVPEPQKGEVKPRSSVTIEVWLHMAWQKRLSELPWRGKITVKCNGQEKGVRVQIQTSAPPALPHLSVGSPLTPTTPTSTLTSTSSLAVRSPKDSVGTTVGRYLQLASANIHFPRACVSDVLEKMLELTNTSAEPVRLKMSAFAPAYVKGSDDSNTVKRVGYQVFSISPSTADLLPRETMKVPVKFCPRTKGTFNQHWEVEYQALTSGRQGSQAKVTTKISLTAEVSDGSGESESSSRKPKWDSVSDVKSSADRGRTPLVEKHPNTGSSRRDQTHSSTQELQLMTDKVTFTSTKVGQVTQVKVEFKNSFEHNVELEAEAPKAPFTIKHKAFKITKKRFLKYPIQFSPTVAGTFRDSVVFRAPSLGKTFTVQLEGSGL